MVATDLEGASRRARQADAARARGESWGPLHGLPLTLKDSWEVVGMPATSGVRTWSHHRPQRHADAVQRLVDAGAIPFGKTNLPALAGEWQSFNKVHGTTNNPWDLTRTPGGSSGGAAAAVAAGLSPVELGSDIGGSIRIPAHFCGVFGHKPTHGILPMRGHLPGPPGTQSEPDLAVGGPLARSARDLQLLMDVLAGARDDEVGWRLQLPPPVSGDLAELRVAVWLDDPMAPLEACVRAVLDGAIGRLVDAGLRARPADRRLDEVMEPYVRLLAAVVGAGLPRTVVRRIRRSLPLLRLAWRLRPPESRATPSRYNSLGPSPSAAGLPASPLLGSYLEGVLQTHADWLRVNERRNRLMASWARWFEDVDVLLMPVAPWAAVPHAQQGQVITRSIEVPSGTRPYVDHLMWVGPATVLGLPATSVPVGRTEGGLPVGLQVVCPRFADRSCLAVAAEIERVLGGFTAPPSSS